MKTIQIKVIILLIASSVLSSCKKDDKMESTPTSGFSSLEEFYNKYAVKSQYFNINNNAQQVITGNQGSIVTFPANSLVHANGQPATGNVRVEIKEIYKKSDMLFADKPTMTATGPLLSGGEIFIQAIEETSGEILQVANNAEVGIFMPAVAPPDSMNLFIATANMAEFTWVPAPGTGWSNTIFTTPTGYQISTDTLTWINCDQPIFSNPWLILDMHANDNPVDYNTDVFLFFPNKSVIHLYQNNNNDFRNYYTPKNSTMTAVAIGLKNGKLYSAFVPVTATNSNLTVNFTLQETSEAALTAAILGLD